MAYVGCVAGAISIDDYRRSLIDAGFSHVEVIDTQSDLNAYAQVNEQAGCCGSSGCCGSTVAASKDFDANEYAASVRVLAVMAP